MKNKIDCALVRDLLPSYVDKITSEETNEILKEHLETCETCNKELSEMLYEIQAEKATPHQDLKIYLSKTKQMYVLKGILLSIGILGVFVSFCVDIAMNHKLTWSLIVDMGICYAYATLFAVLLSKKHKIRNMILTMSILLLPMLWAMEYIINANFLVRPYFWFEKYALPISLIWILILNTIVFIYYRLKNIWYTLGIVLILSAIGSIATDYLASNLTYHEVSFINSLNWIDAVAYFICGILCILIGFKRKINK